MLLAAQLKLELDTTQQVEDKTKIHAIRMTCYYPNWLSRIARYMSLQNVFIWLFCVPRIWTTNAHRAHRVGFKKIFFKLRFAKTSKMIYLRYHIFLIFSSVPLFFRRRKWFVKMHVEFETFPCSHSRTPNIYMYHDGEWSHSYMRQVATRVHESSLIDAYIIRYAMHTDYRV